MKKILSPIVSIAFCLFLCIDTVSAQSSNEIRLKVWDSPLVTDKNLVSVSTFVNEKQSPRDGIHFSITVKNNSSKAIFIVNTASRLGIFLFNEFGFDVSVKNVYDRAVVDDWDRSWKFRSEAIFPSGLYTNGKQEKIDVKLREYFEVPAGGTSKVDLIIKNVKQIENTKDLEDKYLKPKVKIEPGKYKLQMLVSIISKDKSKSGGLIAVFQSPMIDIDYRE